LRLGEARVTSDFAHREQVVEAVESGVALPHDGRLIDGDAAAA
jgi:hypothetical protein